MSHGRVQDFGLGGALAGDLGDGSPAAGFRGRAPEGSGAKPPVAQKP